MIQEIATYLIIGVAATAALRNLYNHLGKKKRNEGCSHPTHGENPGCGSCAADCPLKTGAPNDNMPLQ